MLGEEALLGQMAVQAPLVELGRVDFLGSGATLGLRDLVG